VFAKIEKSLEIQVFDVFQERARSFFLFLSIFLTEAQNNTYLKNIYAKPQLKDYFRLS